MRLSAGRQVKKMNEVECKKTNARIACVHIIRLNVTKFIFRKSFVVLIFGYFSIKRKVHRKVFYYSSSNYPSPGKIRGPKHKKCCYASKSNNLIPKPKNFLTKPKNFLPKLKIFFTKSEKNLLKPKNNLMKPEKYLPKSKKILMKSEKFIPKSEKFLSKPEKLLTIPYIRSAKTKTQVTQC